MIYDSIVQEKLFGVLNGLGIPVYDYVPTNSNEFPYVKIDSCYYMDNSTKAEEGIQLIQYVQVFSDYKGKKEIRDLVAQMNNLVVNGDYDNEDQECLSRYDIPQTQCALAGDQIYTDVLGANCAGIRSILIKSIDNHTFWLKVRHVLEKPFIYLARKRRISQ